MVYFYWVINVLVSINFYKQTTMNLWFYYGCRWQDIWQMDKVCQWCIIRNPYFILEAKSFMSNPLCTFKSDYMNWVIWLLLLTLTHCKQTPHICLSVVSGLDAGRRSIWVNCFVFTICTGFLQNSTRMCSNGTKLGCVFEFRKHVCGYVAN